MTTETITDEDTISTTEVLYYAYDANGSPLSVILTDATGAESTYYYAVNIQGDFTAILTTSGTAVVEYTYDAWGNPLAVTGTLADTLGETNSLRYRGYVYDTETGYYYLQSRYYNPELGRFINADSYASTGQGLLGNNMFAYCGNNSVVFVDPTGTMECLDTQTLQLSYYGDISITTGDLLNLGITIHFFSSLTKLFTSTQEEAGAVSAGIAVSANLADLVEQEIADRLAKVVPRTYRSDFEVHHIVAKNARGAAISRLVLDSVGIEIGSLYNLVPLKPGVHRRLHTKLYYVWVDTVIVSAYITGRGDNQRQNNVILALNGLKIAILAFDNLLPD